MNIDFEIYSIIQWPEKNEKMNFTDTLTSILSGETSVSFQLIIDFVKDQFFYELESSRGSIIYILLLVIIAAVFANFSSVFKSINIVWRASGNNRGRL